MGGGGGGGLLGGVGQVLFGDNGAEAAQNAAISQQIEARNQYNLTKGRIDTANANFASRMGQAESGLNASTVAGLTSLERDIGNQEKNLSRQEQLVSQIDPTIIEASQQALRLLRGEQSSTLNPLKNQRDQQRQKLVNSLREQLGPGAETSTAGIQALTRFDSESSNIYAGAQQQALGNLGGLSTQFNQVRPDMFREIAGLSSLGQQKYQLGANQANFYQNWANQGAQNDFSGINALGQAGQANVQSAGAGFTGAAIKGQAASSFGNALIGAAGSYFGAKAAGAAAKAV